LLAGVVATWTAAVLISSDVLGIIIRGFAVIANQLGTTEVPGTSPYVPLTASV